MRNKKGLIGQIFFWLFIFVAGSLIVNFIVYGGLNNFIDKGKDLMMDKDLKYANEELGYEGIVSTFGIISCGELKKSANQNGISLEEKIESICDPQCSIIYDKVFFNYECRNSGLICYCRE